MRDDAEAVGSLRSRRSVVLRPEISGRITQLNFRDGQRVHKGQLLVQLDDQLPRAQVQQSRAELSIARANHKRNQELVAQGFISQRSVDESAANLEVAEAKLALSEATAQRLRILAPFDGIAGIRGVNVGDYLKDGADIVNVEDLDAVYVDFRLPERLQDKVKPGQLARVAFDALPGVQYSAVVQAINPQIDADGRSIAVRGCIDNRRLQLRPGMFARVTAVFGERADARVIPEEAIVPDGTAPYVLRIVPGKEEGSKIAKRTPVRLGARTPRLCRGGGRVGRRGRGGDRRAATLAARWSGRACGRAGSSLRAMPRQRRRPLQPRLHPLQTLRLQPPAAASATVVATSTRAASAAASPPPGLPDVRAANPCQGAAEPTVPPGPTRAARGARSS